MKIVSYFFWKRKIIIKNNLKKEKKQQPNRFRASMQHETWIGVKKHLRCFSSDSTRPPADEGSVKQRGNMAPSGGGSALAVLVPAEKHHHAPPQDVEPGPLLLRHREATDLVRRRVLIFSPPSAACPPRPPRCALAHTTTTVRAHAGGKRSSRLRSPGFLPCGRSSLLDITDRLPYNGRSWSSLRSRRPHDCNTFMVVSVRMTTTTILSFTLNSPRPNTCFVIGRIGAPSCSKVNHISYFLFLC